MRWFLSREQIATSKSLQQQMFHSRATCLTRRRTGMSKTLLVTGASRGIGFATAQRFLKADNDVTSLILLARDSTTFDENFTRLQENNPHGKSLFRYHIDLGHRESLLELLPRIFSEHKSIELLVNNAGYTNPVPFHQVEFDDFQRTIAVNLYAPFTVVQELLHLGNRFEFIVNVASTAGMNGRAGWLTYSASKAAVINMSEVMRDELAIYGTRVVCISPGRTATELRKTLAPDEDPTTIMQPDHVGAVIEMLASPVGKYVDSRNLVVRQ